MSAAMPDSSSIPRADEVIVPASDAVTLDGLALPLLEYAVRLGYLHWLLFGAPLLIARVYEPIHGIPVPLRAGTTVAFELEQLTAEDQFVFVALIAYSAPANNCTVFDVRTLPPGKRVGVEYHGE